MKGTLEARVFGFENYEHELDIPASAYKAFGARRGGKAIMEVLLMRNIMINELRNRIPNNPLQ